MLSPLSSPFLFRNGKLAPNRVWLAPMTNGQSHPDGSLGDEELAWLVRRAEGGFGVVETCAAHVAEDGKAWEGELGVFDDRLAPGLARLARAIKVEGAVALAQLFHGGVRADPKLTGVPTWSASAFEEPNVTPPREGTEDDITGVIARFTAAAARCERAGFDGVELHGAHGYLFGQFLSSTHNRRADRWGGSLENRARLLRETLASVRSAVSPGFIVGVRISPEDWGNAKGLDLDDSLTLARWLAEGGIDFLHLSVWNTSKNSTKRPEQHVLPLFREVVPRDVPIVIAGTIWTRAEAEALLEKGATGVALGRSAIINPDWPRRIEDPKWEPKRPPVTIPELVERSLSPKFAELMRRWKGFVAD